MTELLRPYEEGAENVLGYSEMESLVKSDKICLTNSLVSVKTKHLLSHKRIIYEFKLAGD